jgi:hypothetical protein
MIPICRIGIRLEIRGGDPTILRHILDDLREDLRLTDIGQRSVAVMVLVTYVPLYQELLGSIRRRNSVLEGNSSHVARLSISPQKQDNQGRKR